MQKKLILASSSKDRLALLKSIDIVPDQVLPADIDESPLKNEHYKSLVKRLAYEKCNKVALCIRDGFVLAADTIVVCKNMIMDKTNDDSVIRSYLARSSGGRNIVITAVTVIKKENGVVAGIAKKMVSSTIKFKKLSEKDIEDYILSGDGRGKSGGMAIDGKTAIFMKWIKGSPSGTIGLPLCETVNALRGLGFDY